MRNYLKPDAFYRFIGPKNRGKALIDDELTTCLLDNGAQLNFITPAYAQGRGMDIMSLDYLAREIGGPIPPMSPVWLMTLETTSKSVVVVGNLRLPCLSLH